MIRGGLKDLPTVPATAILHQAAPEENGRVHSLRKCRSGLTIMWVQSRLKNHQMFQLGIGISVCRAA
jgi:hypothetical protein